MGMNVRILTVLGAACGVLAMAGLATLPAGAASADAPDRRIDGFSTWSPEDDRYTDRDPYDYYGDREGRYGGRYYRGRYDRYNGRYYDERRRDRYWREREYIRRPEILKPAERPNNQKWRRRKEANFSITTVNPQVGRDGKGVYRTIREAIDHTRPGGTVLIQPGVYAESLLITWPIYLRADVRDAMNDETNRESVVIRPPSNQPCVAVAVLDNEWVKIRDLSFESGGGTNSQGCIVHRNGTLTLQDAHIAADAESAGVYLAGGSADLENNEINGGRIGIYVGPSAMDTPGIRTYRLIDNLVELNEIGINVDAFDAKVILENSTVSQNGEAGLIVAKGRIEATRNEFNRNRDDGVVVLYPDEVSLKENNMYGNGRYGLYMPLADRVSLTANSISCNMTAGVASSRLLNTYDEDDDLDDIATEQYPGNEIEFNPPSRRRRGFFSRGLRSLTGDPTGEEICLTPPDPPFDEEQEDGYEEVDYDDLSAR